MDIGIEALATATFLLLPGFVAASVFSAFAGRRQKDGVQVTLFSLIASLFLFVISMIVLIAFKEINFDLSKPSKGFIDDLTKIPAIKVLKLFTVMMFCAVLWGVLTGLLYKWRLSSVLYRLRLTPIGPADNVFDDALRSRFSVSGNLSKRGTGHMEVPWLRVSGESGDVFGRLRKATVQIEPNEPFEIYLSPCFLPAENPSRENSPWLTLSCEGLYRHIMPTDSVHVFSAPENWSPNEERLEPPITDEGH